MSNPWFKFHSDALNNPKVQRLPAELFRAWVNLMCVTSRCDGRVTSHGDAQFMLRLSESDYWETVKALGEEGLVTLSDDGVIVANWDERQFTKKTSAERTRAYRERKRKQVEEAAKLAAAQGADGDATGDGHSDVTVTPSDTDTDTDSSADAEQTAPSGKPKPVRHEYPDAFERIWPLFDNRTNKARALAEWRKFQPDEALTARMEAALSRERDWRSKAARAGQFAARQQDPERWIKNQRWTDEIPEVETHGRSQHHGFDKQTYGGDVADAEADFGPVAAAVG